MRLLFMAILLVALVACSSEPDDPADTLDQADAIETTPVPCPNVIEEGEDCASEAQQCSQNCTDPCSACGLWECRQGKWAAAESAPAECFACGDDDCVLPQQYCETYSGGAGPGFTSSSCREAPSACDGIASCDCIEENGSICSVRDGGVHVTIMTP